MKKGGTSHLNPGTTKRVNRRDFVVFDGALFGNETKYAELDSAMEFVLTETGVVGTEIWLTKKPDGNLNEIRLRPDQF